MLRISKNLLFYSWFSEKKKWCIIYIMIRRISFSLFLIYEFHLIIYLFSLISWFKREQVIHIECFLCTIRNSSSINTVSADNNNISILVLMWPLILPSSSCFPESAIIRLLISSKNQTIRIWYEKNIFSFCKCHSGLSPAAAITSKLHRYFDLFYHLGLASISFFWESNKMVF